MKLVTVTLPLDDLVLASFALVALGYRKGILSHDTNKSEQELQEHIDSVPDGYLASVTIKFGELIEGVEASETER